MDLAEGSRTSAKHNSTPGKYPKEHIERFHLSARVERLRIGRSNRPQSVGASLPSYMEMEIKHFSKLLYSFLLFFIYQAMVKLHKPNLTYHELWRGVRCWRVWCSGIRFVERMILDYFLNNLLTVSGSLTVISPKGKGGFPEGKADGASS
jgi:hypothetical protein